MMQSPTQRPSRLASTWALPIVLMILVSWHGFLRARFGLDLTDEGLYASAPLRYTMGDAPLRDEMMNYVRMFDVLMWPAFALHSSISLYGLRCAAVTLQLTSAVLLFSLFARFSPPFLAASAVAATSFYMTRIWTPGYWLLTSHLLLISLVLYTFACLAQTRLRKLALGLAGGVLFSGSALAYFPTLLVLAVPAFVLAAAVCRPSLFGRCRTPSTAFLTAALVPTAVGLVLLVSAGLVPHFIEAHKVIAAFPVYSQGLEQKVRTFLRISIRCVPHTLSTVGLVACVERILSIKMERLLKAIRLCLPICTAGFVILIVKYIPPIDSRGGLFHVQYCITSAAVGINIAGLLLCGRCVGQRTPRMQEWMMCLLILVPSALAFLCVAGLLSGSIFVNGTRITPLILGVGVVSLGMSLSCSQPQHAPARNAPPAQQVWLASLCLAYAFLNLQSQWTRTYRDAPPPSLTAEFSSPQLTGIRSTPDRVAALDALLAFLEPRVDRGDFLLACPNSAMLYYLTGTRPAERYTWSTNRWPLWFREDNVRYMIENNRVPDYCVVLRQWPPGRKSAADANAAASPGNGPMAEFVRENYELIESIHPFLIWQRRTPETARDEH